MSPNPADRPSAREVLRSDILPPRVEDEQLNDLLRSLPDSPETYDRYTGVRTVLNSSLTSSVRRCKVPFAAGHHRGPPSSLARYIVTRFHCSNQQLAQCVSLSKVAR